MKNKSLAAILTIALFSTFSLKTSYANPGAEKESAQEIIISGGFFEDGYEEQETIPDLIKYSLNEWGLFFFELNRAGYKNINLFAKLGLLTDSRFDINRLVEYDKMTQENFKQLGIKVDSWDYKNGIYTLKIERINPIYPEHKIVETEFDAGRYYEIRNSLTSDLLEYFENPLLERSKNPNEKFSSSGDLISKISFYD